jgi:hypothetical protein
VAPLLRVRRQGHPVSARWPIPRPTERAALAAAERSARPLPPVPALFAALLTACALDDRHGANLAGHHIARTAGGPDR